MTICKRLFCSSPEINSIHFMSLLLRITILLHISQYLIKKDEYMLPKMERVPFMEEQVRIIREQGKLLTMDIERLLLSEDNRFDFVNEIAAEANSYVESNRDEYGGEKKAILHVLSNRMNDTGIYRPEAYYEPDHFKPGPHYLREEFT
ncbi:protein PLASTID TRANSCRIPTIONALLY ACTIVE 7 isoform X3 [Cajanus cajan]|uniref:protein PLASTID TRANSCRIPTIONALLY ACTIVE 7 isoform X3 n=1 Tax=Cajanus cajan TaxID=3821 RepID=UPI00098D7A80|nr:protein PLASTID TRANSCRIPTIONALLY ACTIVE 7 isoform X3 [Cajanus cajan]